MAAWRSWSASEGAGISRLVREHCDELVSLPLYGAVESLNAAASLAAVLYAYVLPRGDAPKAGGRLRLGRRGAAR